MNGARAEAMPGRGILDQRLEEQRRRAWQAQGICSMVALALDIGVSPVDGTINQNVACDAAQALYAACGIISKVTGDLEPDVLLSDKLRLGEEAEEVQP